ncbi:MAG: ferrous iron transport protein A [Melioribacteraceae bacterium]|nr:ferrous iron transport protein A [Melioribacteraceae bacterium]MCO6474576.1 ferrous iron transport protein A [Melioribacteraceae bacterium]MDD3558943.1 ferrous iron transport protein A [Melioribacteraceae bacterium]
MALTLDKALKGHSLTIAKLPNGDIKSQLIRLGITEGLTVSCIEKLPGGTIVLRRNRQEIALGSALAKSIEIVL